MIEFEQRTLPNASAVLALGIISIIGCCCYGVLGIIVAVIALVLFKQDKAKYDLNPSIYTNYSTLNIGRILAIIGLSFSVLYILLIILAISIFGWEALQNQELLQERLQELQ